MSDTVPTPSEPPTIAILGIGAMACLFGSRLTAHTTVTLIGTWLEQVNTLRRQRLVVRNPDGSKDWFDINAQSTPADVEPVDVVLMLTKSTKTERAAHVAEGLLKPDGIAVTLQNGLGNLDLLTEFVGPERAIAGSTAMGATLEGPGAIRFGGGGTTTLATRPEISAQVEALADLLNEAGLPTETTTNIDGVLWGKLVINAAINPLTTILRCRNGELLRSDETRGLMFDAAREAAAVASALKVTLPYDDPLGHVEQVAENTAENTSSMLQDALRNSPTEIDVISGAVARAGEQAGVPTPVNELLWRLVKAQEAVESAS